jgi:tRNA-intron endonuclease
MNNGKIRGELIENRIVIWNIEHARQLFRNGFYGKPLGIPKPKGDDFNAPLILDLIEGYYLAKKGMLEIYTGNRIGTNSKHSTIEEEKSRNSNSIININAYNTAKDHSLRVVSLKEMTSICRKEYAHFDSKYMVFAALRDKGYVVTPGIKFGCDFAVYEHGPGIDHAPYLVQVVNPSDMLTATMVVLYGRLATTVRKQFILAIARVKEKSVVFLAFDWWRA